MAARTTQDEKDLCSVESVSGRSSEQPRDLLHIEKELKESLLQNCERTVPSKDIHERIMDFMHYTELLREECRQNKTHLRTASSNYQDFTASCSEIATRRHFLEEVKSTITHIKKIQLVAVEVDDALAERDHGGVNQASVEFESLNETAPLRMDERYKCLQPLAHRVATAVADSMRLLRMALRESCVHFDPAGVAKCMSDFHNIGASSQFLPYVFQIYAEEGKNNFEKALAAETEASHKAEFFCSRIHYVLVQLSRVLHLPTELSSDAQEKHEHQLYWDFKASSEFPEPPFHKFAMLGARLFSYLKLELLDEDCFSILNVAASAQELLEKLATTSVQFEYLQLSGRAGNVLHSPTPENESETVALRRGTKPTDFERQRSLYRTNAHQSIISVESIQSFSVAVQQMGREWLAVRHASRKQELLLNTSTVESWIRIKLPEVELHALLKSAFEGIGGRIQDKIKECSECSKPNDDLLSSATNSTSPATVTLTPASLGLLRWVSEYATVAVAIAGTQPDALGTIMDIFLVQLYSSLEMNDTIHSSRSMPLFKSLEDLVLERPKEKSIADFIQPRAKEPFQIIVERYKDQRAVQPAMALQFQSRSSDGGTLSKKLIRTGSASVSKTDTQLEQATRQCVAAEEIGTLCQILRSFAQLIERISSNSRCKKEHQGTLLLASLRSALVIGEEVQGAMYGLLAWDVVGGWDAILAIAGTCRSFHQYTDLEIDKTASKASPYVMEMMSRIRCGYLDVYLPPKAAERLSFMVCETAMDAVLEGFSRVQYCSHTAAASQVLLDIRTLDLALTEHTGICPCPGRMRTEMYVKATFLSEDELKEWIDCHKRKLNLSKNQVDALVLGCQRNEVSVVDQIIAL